MRDHAAEIADARCWLEFYAEKAREGMRIGNPWLQRLAESRYWLWTIRLRILTRR